MGAKNSEFKANVNRLVWMALFVCVSAVFIWMEWRSEDLSVAAWFLAAGMWSAVCGVGYSVCDWFFQDKQAEKIPVGTAAEEDTNSGQ